MDSFPAFIPLSGRRVVVAGAGEAAEAKARLFDGAPCELVRLEDEAALRPEAYAGAALAFIAGQSPFTEQAAAAARAAGVLVNVVDRPELCDFTTPAIVDRGPVVAAVGTGGAAPLLAAHLRSLLEAQLPADAGETAAALAARQAKVRAALPELPARRAFLRAVIAGAAGDFDAALAEAARRRAAGEAPAARRHLISSGRAADDLTVRDVRALAQADVVLNGETAAPGVLVFARRDAARVAPADLAGLLIVEIVDDPPA